MIFVFLLSQWLSTGSSNSYLSPLACCGCSAFVNVTEESSALGDLDILDIKSQDKHLQSSIFPPSFSSQSTTSSNHSNRGSYHSFPERSTTGYQVMTSFINNMADGKRIVVVDKSDF